MARCRNRTSALYSATVHRLSAQLYLMTGNREEAHDCVQEAFERAWLRWPQVQTLNSPEAWVRTVARRLAGSRWRKGRNALTAWQRHRDTTSDVIDGSEEGAAQRRALMDALQQLPTAQRVAIVLHYLCDLDVAAVSAETGVNPSTVKSQLSRGRERLARLLDDPRIDDTSSHPEGLTRKATR
jgi:RNA polymerase sigma-70 factor (ECF subfamily)